MKTQINNINPFQSSFIAFLLVSFLFVGCSENCIDGVGSPTTSILELSDFNGIHLDIASDVTFTQGETQEVRAVGEANIIERLKTNVSNKIWTIDFEKGCYRDYQLEIFITLPDLNSISIDGSGDIIINDFFNQDELRFDIDGSGEIAMNSFEGLQTLTIDIDGSGDITANENISGVDHLHVHIEGSGNFAGFPIKSNHCSVRIDGSGDAEVTANEELEARIDGSGTIYYKGYPNVDQTVSGSGDIINRN